MRDLSVIEAEFGDLSRWTVCPDFWPATPALGQPFIDSLREANLRVIGRSAGGRDIIALEYGEKEPHGGVTDNLQSVLGSRVVPPDPTDIFPEAFYGKTRRRKPVLVLQGGIHGGELSGTVASLNLCHIIETGHDLRGKAWPELQKLALGTRILIIPWLNIDGVVRWPLPNTSGVPADLNARCTFGVATDGTKYAYPEMKAVSPIPPDQTAFMGTYFNDAGVNLQYDFCQPERQPETTAWMKYYLDERPDGVLIWHCNSGSMIGPPPPYVPIGHQIEEERLGGALRARLLRESFEIGRMSWAGLPGLGKPNLTQIDAVYHACGALPILCELPTGGEPLVFSLDQVLDIGLITLEETLSYAHRDGLRPYELWDKVKKTFA